MALIVRIDVDRPYGKQPWLRHLLSRLSSEAYLPRLEGFGYLDELKWMLRLLNEHGARAYVFFRRCTLPSAPVLGLIEEGGHEVGLHLENSRSFADFCEERQVLEDHVGRPVVAFSKHGSGKGRYGRRHYAPYEPQKYLEWGRQTGMKLLLGNLEDPSLEPSREGSGLTFYPAAFWLEPHWRDVGRFPIEWLRAERRRRNIVLLVHPENVKEQPSLTQAFEELIAQSEIQVVT